MSMINSDNFEDVFLERLSHHNISAVKNFFNFEPVKTERPKSRIDIPIAIKQKTYKNESRKKLVVKKFTGGFYDKSIVKNNDEQLFGKAPISLQSKKAPQLQLCTFLIGINSKLQREYNFKLSESQEKKKTIPFKSYGYDSMLNNLNKIKQPKIPDIVVNFKNQNNPELPSLHKKIISSPAKDGKQTSTEIYKEVKNKSLISLQNSSRVPNSSVDSRHKRTIIFPESILTDYKVYQKGYMTYQVESLEFWKKNQQNLVQQNQLAINGISAKHYTILNIKNLSIISSKYQQVQVQIASLTKVMTCYLCILVCKKYEINMNNYFVRVLDKVNEIPGTSAQLQPGDILTLYQLLYGLMLPSGNDAALMIAETIGKIIQKYKKKPTRKTPYQTFINHMNLLAKQLKLNQQFQNSHGLSCNPNFSSAIAISTLATIALRNPVFKTIVNTKQFQFELKNDRFGLSRKVNWKNTNKLLWKGWQGVKTGTTQTAGHCLMALKNNYLICVLDCQTLNKRFSDCIKILEEVQKAYQTN